jgi:hypothetical protein
LLFLPGETIFDALLGQFPEPAPGDAGKIAELRFRVFVVEDGEALAARLSEHVLNQDRQMDRLIVDTLPRAIHDLNAVNVALKT